MEGRIRSSRQQSTSMIDVGRLCRRVPRMGALGSCLRFGAQPRTTPPHAPARLQSAYLLHQLPPSLLRPTAVWHPGGSGRSRPTRSNGGRGCLWSLWWGGLALCGGGERSLVGEDLAVAGLGKGRGTEHGERGGGGKGSACGCVGGRQPLSHHALLPAHGGGPPTGPLERCP